MADTVRYVVLDTETTGVGDGHRLVEVGAVEVDGIDETGRVFHRLFDPGREIDAGATKVHGYTREMLRDEATFEEHAAEFAEFVRGAVLVIHNASFDVGYLAMELEFAGFTPTWAGVVDTLALARIRFPTYNNSLDALADRFGIDRSHRTKHGALVDARLLHAVWIRLTGVDQLLPVETDHGRTDPTREVAEEFPASAMLLVAGAPFVVVPTSEEDARHLALVSKLGPKAVWAQVLQPGV